MLGVSCWYTTQDLLQQQMYFRSAHSVGVFSRSKITTSPLRHAIFRVEFIWSSMLSWKFHECFSNFNTFHGIPYQNQEGFFLQYSNNYYVITHTSKWTQINNGFYLYNKKIINRMQGFFPNFSWVFEFSHLETSKMLCLSFACLTQLEPLDDY